MPISYQRDEEIDIDQILQEKRERSLRVAEATARFWARNKRENLETRLCVASIEKQRLEEFKRALQKNNDKHSHRTEKSPLRHDVGSNYFRTRAKKEKEALQQREYAKIERILDSMKGTPEIDVLRLAPANIMAHVVSDPLSKIELQRRRTQRDRKEIKKELGFLSMMVNRCLVDTAQKFPLLASNPKVQSAIRPEAVNLRLEPHTDTTLFIRNDPDYVRAVAFAEAV